MNPLWYYLIIINVIGFITAAVIAKLRKKTVEGQMNIIITLMTLLGGSLGILLAVLAFDTKVVKENIMSRVFIVCIFVIQVIILLTVHGVHGEKLNLDFLEFFKRYKFFTIYLGAVNFVTLISFAVDKIAAVKDKARIKIVTLLGLCFVGGSVGGLIGMYLFRHKTQKSYFSKGIPLIVLMQAVVLFYVMNL